MGAISDILRFLKLKPPKNHSQLGEYWERRAKLHYYNTVKVWIGELGSGEWILDVGSRSTPLVLEGEFTRRTMVDIAPFNREFPGVEQIVSDWLQFPLDRQADLVLCLQVLEHLPDEIVGPFTEKLLKAGKHVIISVPHLWPEDDCKYHLQDPVDLEKVVTWTGKQPLKHFVETRDSKDRLIALFQGN